MLKLAEKNKVRLWVVMLLIITLVLGAIDYPKYINHVIDLVNIKLKTQIPHVYNLPFHLGLDLQGGTHLVYEADVSKVPTDEIPSSVEGVRDVIERRVNSLGVSEPIIQINQAGDKWRVIVELAGIKDVKEAIEMIGKTPLLEFKEQNTEPARALTDEEKKQIDNYNKEAKKKAMNLLAQAKTVDDFEKFVMENAEDSFTKQYRGNLGYISKDTQGTEELYAAIKKNKPTIGSVINQVLEDANGYNIIKINDIRNKEIKASHILICYQGAKECDKSTTKEEAKKIIENLKLKVTPQNFGEMAARNSTEPAASSSRGDLGWFGYGKMVPTFSEVAFSLKKGEISDVVETDYGYHLIYKEDERAADPEYKITRLLVRKKTESDILPPSDQWKYTGLTGKHLKLANVQFDPYTKAPQVGIEFNDEGAKLFAEITSRNVGQLVAIFLDGQPISIPRVNEVIKDGKAVITGDFDITEAKTLSQRLNAGALPVPIQLINQQTIGASLGAESLSKILFAGIWGVIFVALFMIMYYRLPGLLSVLALLFYSITLLFLFKIIPITLTLSGIAGFILSLGMAVDANILIFERMKEELKIGKSLSTAISEGFKRAWPSIRDGNMSTLITCFILAWFGTSMIKGFAITLGVGVMVSMLSAILVTRILLKLFVNNKFFEKAIFFLGIGIKK